MIGKGNGIENGILLSENKNNKKTGFEYRFGVFEPAAFSSNMLINRIYTTRLSITTGNLNSENKYCTIISRNPKIWEKSLTIGFGASFQSKGSTSALTEFKNSKSFGSDILLNIYNFWIDSEYYFFTRSGYENTIFNGKEWHIKSGYNLPLKNFMIEATFSYDRFFGRGNNQLYRYIGLDETADVGMNFFANNEKIRYALHYLYKNHQTENVRGNFMIASFTFKL